MEQLIALYAKLSPENLDILILLIKIPLCLLFGLAVVWFNSLKSFGWLRNNLNLYVGGMLPILGLVITTVIGSNIALSLGMIGALSIVRFRTPVRSSYELTIYFLLLTIGIAAKVNLTISFIVTIVGSLLLIILSYLTEKFSKNDFKIFFVNLKMLVNFEELSILVKHRNLNDLSILGITNKKNYEINLNISFEIQNEQSKFLNNWKKNIIKLDVHKQDKSF